MKRANANALDGLTLETIVRALVDRIGWESMALHIPLRCFTHDPSVNSSLKFLRRTPWARAKVEQLYLHYAPVPSGTAQTKDEDND